AALAVVVPTPASAGGDDDFMAAREAFRTGDRAQLDALAPKLEGHVLQPYVAYYRMRQRIDEASPEAVRAQIAQLADGPMADRLRSDWLKALARSGDWELFDAESSALRSRDAEIVCYGLQRALMLGEPGAQETVRKHWLSARIVPEPCNAAYAAAIAAGGIDADDGRAGSRPALQDGPVSRTPSL